MHAISSYRGNRPTNKQNKHTDRGDYNTLRRSLARSVIKLVPWGTDGRLPLSDLDLDLGSSHTAYRRVSVTDLYLRTKFH